MLFAEDTGTPLGITATLITAFTGLLALMGWLVRHMLTVSLPEQAQAFATVNKATLEEAAKLREQFDRRQEALLVHCEAEAQKERDGSERRYQFALARMEQLQQTVTDHGQTLRAILAIAQQRTRQADAVESLEEALWIKSLDGVILYWNPAAERLLGWRRTELVGQSVYKVIPGDLHEQERGVLEKAARGESVQHYHTSRLHKDGRRIDLVITVSPVADSSGKVIGVSSIGREV